MTDGRGPSSSGPRSTPADHELPTRTEAEGATVDLPEGTGFFTTGQVLGERYEILEMLGRGGMGEVWRAFDLKLRVEVGLKALREELFQSERRLELLRQEVRAAREVVSPNVCRIFDLIEIDGREMVSMEYVDGATLLGVLQERGPMELKEAQDIASQFLAGLEAIHKAGLVHRDVKPENIMLTRAGRVVVMDFGLAREPESGAGSVSGTPAYMAPEHAAGQEVDARADVYSAGVVLAEMVSPDGIKSYESRQSVWEGVRSEPAQIPDSPWAPVIQRTVARDRERRQNSAHTLIRELEDVTLRVEGADDLHPYPGLASFTEEDAEYFFGREAEIEAMWRILDGPSRLLGIMGPSGAGKTSFIRAGLTPSSPVDWSIIRCTPGSAAVASLRGSLTSELAGDPKVLETLVTDPENPDVIVAAVANWRQGHTGALLIVDQFEEVFTLNSRDHQQCFAALLGRLPIETDVHVVLSMRDDFAASCNQYEPLRPVFRELTVLDPPSGGNLRRALVQPATKCGYRFEDDELVEEILSEVEGERGALPLVAFALARLWEKRDRETGLLTRQAYHDIGGVGGALARHAEATVDHIGVERIPIVRELFRNLVTAEGTRAVREWDELLSVFGQPCHPERSGLRGRGVEGSPEGAEIAPPPGATQKRKPDSVPVGDSSTRSSNSLAQNDMGEEAAEVLRELIDARLLTSYEVREDEHEPIRRVEIIHESLLANWPRLVRWQTQDQEGAQLREELRQAARAWDEHDRHDDYLWTGTAYREFRLWRERYPGRLTGLEEAYGRAMTSFAGRRRRKRRLIVATVIAVLTTGLALVGTFWQQSVRETRRAQAANLLSLGQLQLDSFPSSTVAHTIASLELAESKAARLLALEALWKGPTVFTASEDPAGLIRFSPDGQSIVMGGYDGRVTVFDASGSMSIDVPGQASPIGFTEISPSGHFLSRWLDPDSNWRIAIWSTSEKQPLAEATLEAPRAFWDAAVDAARLRAVILYREDSSLRVASLGFDGSFEDLGALESGTTLDDAGRWSTQAMLDPQTGAWLGIVSDSRVYVADVGDHDLGPVRLLGRHNGVVSALACDPIGRYLATMSDDGDIRLWYPGTPGGPTVLKGPSNSSTLRFSSDGSLLEAAIQDDRDYVTWVWDLTESPPRFVNRFNLGLAGQGGWILDTTHHNIARWGPEGHRLWSLAGPSDADPLQLRRGGALQANSIASNPAGSWLATAGFSGIGLWPISRMYPSVISRHDMVALELTFTADGNSLAATASDDIVRLWRLDGRSSPARILGRGKHDLAFSPDGARLLASSSGDVAIHSLEEQPPTTLLGFTNQVWGVAFSPDGRLAAAVGGMFLPAERQIRIWDATTGEERSVFEIDEFPYPYDLHFTPDGDLLSSSYSRLHRWDIETGESESLYEGRVPHFNISADGRRILMVETFTDQFQGRLVFLDLDKGEPAILERFGDDVFSLALDASGTIAVTGDQSGVIRVGPVDGGEPHLFLGHTNLVTSVAIDPLGRWFASASFDKTIRLWPMPDLSKPPLHTLPREALIAKLKTLTNLRVVRDPESSTGWTLTHDPFPGWETVPTW